MKKRGTVLLTVIMMMALVSSIFGFSFAYADEVTPINYATAQENWSDMSIGYTTTSFSDEGMKMTAADTAMAFNKKVAADATMNFVFDGYSNRGSWGCFYVMFKTDGTITPNEVKLVLEGAATSTGNWLAFEFGASWGASFIESNDGVITKTDLAISGHDTWHFLAQKTALSIQTTDTESGVDTKIVYKASGDVDNTGEEKTFTFSSANTSLKGDQFVTVGGFMGLSAGEYVTLSSFTTELAVAQPDEVVLENLASDIAFWKGGDSFVCYQFGENGVGFYDTTSGSMISNQTIPADATITLKMTGTQSAGTYGNFYFILKNEDKSYPISSVTPNASGNYLAFMIGGDGFKIYDCKDGVLSEYVEKDINNGGIVQSFGDIWFWYKQSITLNAVLSDTETGVHVQFKIAGPSGQITTKEYDCDNAKLKGESNLAMGMFLSVAGTSTEFVNIDSLTVSGIEEGYVPDIDVTALNTKATQAASATIGASNLAEIKATVVELKEAQAGMNYTQGRAFQSNLIAQIETNIAAYETAVTEAAAVEAAIDELPETITEANYETAKTAVEAVRSSYDALSDQAKTLVTNLERLTIAETALTTYENGLAYNVVSALIAALPETVTEENYETAKTDIAAARTAYDALTDDEKALVTSYAKLTAAETALTTYEESIKDTEAISCNSVASGAMGVSLLLLAGAALLRKRKSK